MMSLTGMTIMAFAQKKNNKQTNKQTKKQTNYFFSRADPPQDSIRTIEQLSLRSKKVDEFYSTKFNSLNKDKYVSIVVYFLVSKC